MDLANLPRAKPGRIAAVDLARDLVVIVMALDHVRGHWRLLERWRGTVADKLAAFGHATGIGDPLRLRMSRARCARIRSGRWSSSSSVSRVAGMPITSDARLMARLASFAIVALILIAAPTAQAGESTLLFRGGAIYTMDAARPWADAVVVRHGRIAYVGDEAGARSYVDADTRVIDTRGRLLLPAFHDSHVHPMSGGMRLLRCRLDGLDSERGIYAAIRDCAARDPDRPWLLGSGWNPKAFGTSGPDRAKLDALVPDRPAFLATEDGFVAWINAKALADAGIDPVAETSDIDGVHRDAQTHRPNGVVESDAIARVRSHIPRPSEGEYREALRRTAAMANGYGIASIVDANVSADMLAAYRAADAAGELTVRVVAAQRVDPARGVAAIDELVERRDRSAGKRLRADAAKIFLDGEFEQRTAALLEPYADSAQTGPPIDTERLDAIVRRLDAEGFMIHMHAMGDRAVRSGLDAIERAAAANGARDRRHQLAHVGLAARDDVARFAQLGVSANFQPIWFQAKDPAMPGSKAALGPGRARMLFPIASVLDGGARVLASSDWPSPSMSPLDAIQVAMTRQPLEASAPPEQPDQRVTLSAMLAAYTRAAAWAAREDAISGTIEAGKSADLVLLARNPFDVPVLHLHEIRVLATLLEGEPVYLDAKFPWPTAAGARSARRHNDLENPR